MILNSHKPISQATLVSRYLLLYGLFGMVVGIHLSANAWVLMVLSPGWDKGPHFLMALMMAGMLSGEHTGGWISDRYSGRLAVVLAALAFAIAGTVVIIAVLTKHPSLVVVGGLWFGLGLGVQHSSLDTWFTVGMRFYWDRKPTDAQFQWGFSSYTFGFFLGSISAFPLMYGLALNLKIAETHGRMEPIPLPVSTAPYFVAVFACLLVLAFRPYRAAKATVDLTSEPNESQISRTLLSILRSVPQSLSSVAKAYGNVFKIGGVTLATMLIVGSAVSFLIFHIDTFAASDLLSGQTVREKTVGLAILCFGTFAIVAIFSWILESKSRLKTLSPNSRSKILGANLLLSALLLCLLLILRDRSFLITTAVLLAVSSGLLNTLPQLVKWSVLDCANINNKGTAAASLGISKRIPNLVVSLAIGSLGRSNLESTIGFAYVILISGNLIALIALGVYVRKIRRLRITLVYPTDQDVALSATVAAKLDETPNTTVEDITRKQFLDRTQLTVSLSSTSEELLTRVLSTLRSENGVVRALLRRIRVKGRRSQD